MTNYWQGKHYGNAMGHMRDTFDSEKLLKSAGIEEGMVVADLGCGSGFFTLPIASIVGTSGKVYAVDSDAEALDYLRSEIKKRNIGEKVIEIMQADMLSTAIPDHSIDVIFLANVFHDIQDKKAFFKEAKRISKPEAELIDVDWDKVDTLQGPPFQLRIPLKEAEKILSENGFEIVKNIDAGSNHYGLVCKLLKK